VSSSQPLSWPHVMSHDVTEVHHGAEAGGRAARVERGTRRAAAHLLAPPGRKLLPVRGRLCGRPLCPVVRVAHNHQPPQQGAVGADHWDEARQQPGK
jgi:hypothetical protein